MIKASFVWPKGHHGVRKLKSAAKKHGLNLTSCKKDPHRYYITCELPCGSGPKLNALKRTKRMRLSHVSYAGCDR